MDSKTGTFEYVDQQYILAGTKSQLGLRETTAEDAYLLDSINQGVKELRNQGTQVYIVTQLTIDHDSATPRSKLPEGFIRFVKKNPIVYVTVDGRVTTGTADGTVELITSEDDGTNLGVLTLPSMIGWSGYCSPVFVNNAFFENSPYGNVNSMGGTVNLVDGYLYFSSNVIAEYIKIAYLGTNMIGTKIKIPAYCELAVRFFACEAWSSMMFAVTGEQRYRAMMDDFSRKYAKHKAKAKVIPLLPSQVEYEFINYTYNTLI